mmetsp:Transcript_65828/g.157317  ORF Transcript_65828/g.157317 Transcript_65828/m.157317 type:complete len:81 (-) Transcript_65828:50-292(-)
MVCKSTLPTTDGAGIPSDVLSVLQLQAEGCREHAPSNVGGADKLRLCVGSWGICSIFADRDKSDNAIERVTRGQGYELVE